MKKRIRIGLLGSTGRMGKLLQDFLQNDHTYAEDFVLVYSASGPRDPHFDLLSHEKPDVLIDFSAPLATLAMARKCAELKIPMVICTTGFSKQELSKLQGLLDRKVAYLMAPNTSLGVFVLARAVHSMMALLPPEYSVTVIETHHSQKKDAPSGTAKMLAGEILKGGGRKAVPTYSLRGGSEVGEHQIVILGPGERLELSHRANDRSLFVHGALRLAKGILTLKPRRGGYGPADLFLKS